MTPIQWGDVEDGHIVDHEDYFSQTPLFYRDSFLRDLHKLSAWLSGWFDEMVLYCQGVRIYKSIEAAQRNIPDVDLRDEGTVFVVKTCWPNVG